MNLVASDKSYAAGIKGSNDNLEIAYKGDVDADLDDTTLVTVTSSGNVTTTGTLTAATGSMIGNLTLATAVLQIVVVIFHSVTRISNLVQSQLLRF